MPVYLTRRYAPVLLAGALALPACGGGTTATGPTGSNAPVTTSAPAPGVPSASPTPVVAALDKTFWYGGFEVHVTQAEWLVRDGGASVGLTLSLENLRDAKATLNQHDVTLTVGGKSVRSQLNDLPEVPAKAKNDGAVNFYVEGAFALDDATLTVGTPDSNQAIVPLGAADPTTYEPKTATASGPLTTPTAKITLKPGVLDASAVRGERDKYVLRIPLDFTYRGKAAGGYYLAADQFTLELGGGVAVPSAPIVPFDLVAEAVAPGTTLSGRYLSFKTNEPGDGPFTLTFKDSAGGTAKATVTLS